MKFAHLGDCHLGGWNESEIQDLNFKSFQYAISKCINEKVNFILISGDLFDSPYPSIEILKEAFNEFRKVKEAKIPVYLIAGSHDYSVSGKTFLEVLEKGGFCKNVSLFEEREDKIMLLPTIIENCAIYGYSGKKSSLEVEDIERIKLQDAPGMFKILLLHTAIRDAIGTLPIKAVNEKNLPKVDYLALAHLHIKYNKENRVYSGPTFPNNISELEELKGGSFYIVDNGRIRREEINLKQVAVYSLEIKNSLSATEKILQTLELENVKDKIVILKLHGSLDHGKITDIDFSKIEQFMIKKGAYSFLKTITQLHTTDPELKIETASAEMLEQHMIKNFQEKTPGKFTNLLSPLMNLLTFERGEDEKSSVFEGRIYSEFTKIIK